MGAPATSGVAEATGGAGGTTAVATSATAAALPLPIEVTYHVAAAHHERRAWFPRSFADRVPPPLHLVFSSTASTPALENPLYQELIRLDAVRVGYGEVEAQAVARNLFTSPSVFEVGEAIVPVFQDSIRSDAEGTFPLLRQLVRMVLLGNSKEDAVVGVEGGGGVCAAVAILAVGILLAAGRVVRQIPCNSHACDVALVVEATILVQPSCFGSWGSSVEKAHVVRTA